MVHVTSQTIVLVNLNGLIPHAIYLFVMVFQATFIMFAATQMVLVLHQIHVYAKRTILATTVKYQYALTYLQMKLVLVQDMALAFATTLVHVNLAIMVLIAKFQLAMTKWPTLL